MKAAQAQAQQPLPALGFPCNSSVTSPHVHHHVRDTPSNGAPTWKPLELYLTSIDSLSSCALGSYFAKQNWNWGGTKPKVTDSTDSRSIMFQGILAAFLTISSFSSCEASAAAGGQARMPPHSR
jgi:hypothetical protein